MSFLSCQRILIRFFSQDLKEGVKIIINFANLSIIKLEIQRLFHLGFIKTLNTDFNTGQCKLSLRRHNQTFISMNTKFILKIINNIITTFAK